MSHTSVITSCRTSHGGGRVTWRPYHGAPLAPPTNLVFSIPTNDDDEDEAMMMANNNNNTNGGGVCANTVLVPGHVLLPLAEPLRFDVYGYPTLETRVAARGALTKLAADVRQRLAPWVFKAKLREARAAVSRLRGDTADAGDALGTLLELCAHARARTPLAYRRELRAVAAWLVAEAFAQQHVSRPGIVRRAGPIAPVSESSSEHDDDDDDDNDVARRSEDGVFNTESSGTTLRGPVVFPTQRHHQHYGSSSSDAHRDLARVLCDIGKTCA